MLVHDRAHAAGRIGASLGRLARGTTLCAAAFAVGDKGPSAAGREAAAVALYALGGFVEPLGRRHDGAPMWPSLVVGSISHTDGVAVAATGWQPRLTSVGLDLEEVAALPLADSAVALSRHERMWAGLSDSPDVRATALWAAKEAAFKAWSQLPGRAGLSLDPWELKVEVPSERRCWVRVARDQTLWRVRLELLPAHVLALALPGNGR